jgi:signal transduction histidine kinase
VVTFTVNRKSSSTKGLTSFLFYFCQSTSLAVLSTGQPVEVLETIPTAEGYSHYWLVFKFPFQDATGRQLVGGVAVDVTARQRAEVEVYKALAKEKELSELKSHFISTTSHEFRTPLATILSSADMLELYGHKWDEFKKLEHLHRIQTAAEHMTQLLDNVLLVSKVEAGKLQIRPAPIDLAQFCCGLVEEMQLIAGNTHTINFISQGQCTNVCLDERLLRHILTNLLSNAIKYSPQGSTVEFNLVCSRVAAIFTIKDNGIGIPEADQAQLFQSFHRGSNVGTTSGTGLGLTIVKKSVDLHGGEIAVTSEVGAGTTFTITVPLNNWRGKDENDSGN